MVNGWDDKGRRGRRDCRRSGDQRKRRELHGQRRNEDEKKMIVIVKNMPVCLVLLRPASRFGERMNGAMMRIAERRAERLRAESGG